MALRGVPKAALHEARPALRLRWGGAERERSVDAEVRVSKHVCGRLQARDLI